MSKILSAPPTTFADETLALIEEIKGSPLAILCGRNNSGKSYILKSLMQQIGDSAFYLGPARFFSFNAFGVYDSRSSRKAQRYQNLMNTLRSGQGNIDNSPMDLAQAIADLSNTQRSGLFELLKRLLGSDVKMEYSVPDNDMSQKYISVDGYNLAYQSSGFRLAAVLLTCLFEQDIKTLIVDEPELGLSPEVQGVISDFLYDTDERKKLFPHLQTVLISTHSPIFLDRRRIGQNFFVERKANQISIRRLENRRELSSLQFLLLGNRFETLHLPGAIVLVEGPTDHLFIHRLLTVRFPHALISVINCGNDDQIKSKLSIAQQMLGDLRKSAYSDRIFTVLDQMHAQGLVNDLIAMGVQNENVVVWKGNGIEYLYPRELMERHFKGLEDLKIESDEVSANGMTTRKKELAKYIVDNMTGKEELPEELLVKLIRPLDKLLSQT